MKGIRIASVLLFILLVMPLSLRAQEAEKVSNFYTVLTQGVEVARPLFVDPMASLTPEQRKMVDKAMAKQAKKQNALNERAAKADAKAAKARAKLAAKEAEMTRENAEKAKHDESEKTIAAANSTDTTKVETVTPEATEKPASRLEAARARLEAIRKRNKTE